MTDALDLLRRADPAAGTMPALSLDDLSERYVEAEATPGRRGWLGPLAIAAVAVVAVGIGWSVRSGNTRVTAGSRSAKIPADVLNEAKRRMPATAMAQWPALSDGLVTKDEIVAAAAAMSDCLTTKGSGPPQDFKDLGDGVRIPSMFGDRDEECERDNFRWIEWGATTEILLTALGDSEAVIAMAPDADAQQIDAVRVALAKELPRTTVSFGSIDSERATMSGAVPGWPAGPTVLSDVGSRFHLKQVDDYVALQQFESMPGVLSVARRGDLLTVPERPEPAMPTTTVAGQSSLSGKTFVSRSITNGRSHPNITVTEIRLRFDGATLFASSSPSCRVEVGGFTFSDGHLVFTGEGGDYLQSKSCSTSSSVDDRWVHAVLGDRPQFDYQENNGTLTVTAGDTVVVLTDRIDATSDHPLFQTPWELRGIDGPGAPAWVISGLYVQFSSATRFTFGSVCDAQFGADFVLDGEHLSNVSMAKLELACGTTSRPIEADILWHVLTNNPAYAVHGSTMTLTSGQTSLRFAVKDS
jgi:hypothetical protein